MLIHCLSIYFDNFTHESLVRIAGSGDGAGYLIVLVRPTTLDNAIMWQGRTVVAVGGGYLDAFALYYHISFLSPFLLEKTL